jgi:hypothetical protein
MDSPLPDPWANDCLNRKRFGELLLACLQGEAIFADEAFVVALTGKFGSGKSYFLDMWAKHLLVKVGEHPEKFPMVVTVNAWESDFSGEPLLALVSAISNQLRVTRKGKEEKAVKDLKRGLAGAVGVAKWALSGLIEEKTGVPPEEVATAFVDGASGEELDRRANALLSEFKARKQSLEKLRSSLQLLVDSDSAAKGKRELKVILIVDELDRCNPRYAIEFLEAIKHVFNVRGMAVVLGVDWKQLGSAASALFGQHLDIDEYFRKFIRRRIQLPEPSFQEIAALCGKLTDAYFPTGSDLKSVYDLIRRQEGDPSRLLGCYAQALRLTPRQCQSAITTLSFYYRLGESSPRWEMYAVDLFLVSLSVGIPSGFQSVLSCESEPAPAIEFLKSLRLAQIVGNHYNGEFIEARILGTLRSRENAGDFSTLAAKAGFKLGETTGNSMQITEIGKVLNLQFGGDRSYAATVARKLIELENFLS